MIFQTNTIAIETDDRTGETLCMTCTEDRLQTNHILPGMGFGTADGFTLTELRTEGERLICISENKGEALRLTVSKQVIDGAYRECYTLQNTGYGDYFLTHAFGLRFPFSCDYRRGTKITERCTMNHIWCASHTAWIRSQSLTGNGPDLWMTLTDGRLSDYSIHYPADMPITNYRGVFVLHLPDQILPPGGSVTAAFRFCAANTDTPPCALVLHADRYTLFCGEMTPFEVRSETEIHTAAVTDAAGNPIPCKPSEDGKRLLGQLSFSVPGEQTVFAEVNDRRTFMILNVIPPVSELLQKRARFIAEKQQYRAEGSPLDGAYLIYDRDTKARYYSASFRDSNAGRERLSMGVIVACALRERYDEALHASLIRHRTFVERELFDTETGQVFDGIGRRAIERLYNYPWMSDYYFEWYHFSREPQCLLHAASILLRYYEILDGAKQESVCMETYRILLALREAGEAGLYERLYRAFLSHADAIVLRAGKTESEEVSWANGMVSAMVQYTSQAYLLSGNEAYLHTAQKLYRCARVFCSDQPDYHLNHIAVRYWDGFWFGKMKVYGDTLPQWLSSLSGLMAYWYRAAAGASAALSRFTENNLRGALCLFAEDGFAASCYLYPHSVQIDHGNRYQPPDYYVPGNFAGKRYDAWANDQDWALYYAHLLLPQEAASETCEAVLKKN